MASGTTLFLRQFNNLAIFIVLVAAYGALNNYLYRSGRLTRQAAMGREFSIALARDISSRKQAEAALKKSGKLHREAQTIAKLGHWERNEVF